MGLYVDDVCTFHLIVMSVGMAGLSRNTVSGSSAGSHFY